MPLIRTAVLLAIPAAILSTGIATVVETAAAAGPAPATEAGTAQVLCGKRKAVVAELEDRYGETRRSIGLAEGRGIIEVYASERTGSWTILLTTAAGQTCLIAAGEAYEADRRARSGGNA